jgi:hypothetical protein
MFDDSVRHVVSRLLMLFILGMPIVMIVVLMTAFADTRLLALRRRRRREYDHRVAGMSPYTASATAASFTTVALR